MRTQQSTIRSLTAPLRRTPLVPDDVLRKNNVYCSFDHRFRSAARLLQAYWLKDNNISTGFHVTTRDDVVTSMELGSLLSADAARAGRNFMTPEIHSLVRHELIMREDGSVYDQERLMRNALSSHPALFNIFGPLVLNLKLATDVFRCLLPEFVHTVEDLHFEHSPGRREERFLNDGTAFDMALDITTPTGEIGKIYLELKYSEDMAGPAARWRERYDEASRQVRLYRDPDSQMLRSLALEQLWREHMLAQLAVDHGVTDRALFLCVGPRLNRRVQSAFRVYEMELIDTEDQDANRVGFKAITIEQIIDAIRDAGARDIAQALWHRYADFERIFDASISAFDGAFTASDSGDEKANPAVAPAMTDRSRRPLSTRSSSNRRTGSRTSAADPRTMADRNEEQAS